MDNIKVLVYVESRYKVNRKKIVSAVKNLLKEQSVNDSVVVSVAIVGDRKMRELNKKYRNLDKTTNVLSFLQNEREKVIAKSNELHLGDIVISYPQVIKEAAQEEILVDDKIDELVSHGTLHLLGIHHE